ncbi:MAG: 4-hydroxythreonine-4-phosphate dehydrogenase PdxA [Burkholderiaceae bacterium]
MSDAPLPDLIAVTMGDPCGIGPEIVARALAGTTPSRCVVVGDVGVMRRAVAHTGIGVPVAQLDAPEEALAAPPACLSVWEPPGLPGALAELPMGRVAAAAGRAAMACVEAAAALARERRVRAMVTAPIHKRALSAAGSPFPGHTEMLQALAAGNGGAAPEVRMMLANDELSVVLVTIHVGLRRAIELLSEATVLQTIRIAHAAFVRPGRPAPRIAVAGLNPHAGEGGLFGDEEGRIIAPAIAAACREGIAASGPHAPDTVFMRARDAAGHPGEFDVVVAMTHDHGLIPVKYLGIEHGVNVTLGLPFVRTSPDHGTAFDIAGSGRADPRSLAHALSVAHELSGARAHHRAGTG